MIAPGNVPGPIQTKKTAAAQVAAAIWLSSIIAVMVLIIDYSNSPGDSGSPPRQWPVESQVQLDPKHPTLLMFVHPHCPCTRATLGELALLLAHCQGRVSAYVLFSKPDGASGDWDNTDLWRKAITIPGVFALNDLAGVEAKRFRSETSGHTMLYGGDGSLMFEGGITIARGHSGDNPGRSALMALLCGEESQQRKRTPVFGCPLFDAACQDESTKVCHE